MVVLLIYLVYRKPNWTTLFRKHSSVSKTSQPTGLTAPHGEVVSYIISDQAFHIDYALTSTNVTQMVLKVLYSRSR